MWDGLEFFMAVATFPPVFCRSGQNLIWVDAAVLVVIPVDDDAGVFGGDVGLPGEWLSPCAVGATAACSASVDSLLVGVVLRASPGVRVAGIRGDVVWCAGAVCSGVPFCSDVRAGDGEAGAVVQFPCAAFGATMTLNAALDECFPDVAESALPPGGVRATDGDFFWQPDVEGGVPFFGELGVKGADVVITGSELSVDADSAGRVPVNPVVGAGRNEVSSSRATPVVAVRRPGKNFRRKGPAVVLGMELSSYDWVEGL